MKKIIIGFLERHEHNEIGIFKTFKRLIYQLDNIRLFKVCVMII